jgi:hypothetical protein
MIAQVNISNPLSPTLAHEFEEFNGPILDFCKDDSLIIAITNQTFYVLDYDPSLGFNIISSIDYSGGGLTLLAQYYNNSFVVRGELGTVIEISLDDPVNPAVVNEVRLPQAHYTSIDELYGKLWIGGESGIDILGANSLYYLTSYGPEYFSNPQKLYFSPDTIFAADGINGIKVFTFNDDPLAGLTFIGGYGTGNGVNQIARIGDNFIASDYYSLQHLRWGAPTGIEEQNNPSAPREFSLMQNYPNPFNAQTIIRYSLPAQSKADLVILDILGRSVRQFEISGKSHEVIWDGNNSNGLSVASGIYFYTISGRPETARKMILLR